jgi:enoyl-CoA hydratase
MNQLVTYERSGPVARITMNDGKANVMSPAMLGALHGAFDRAQSDQAIVVLTGRDKTFSGGFDLKVFAQGDATEIHSMLKLGGDLAVRLLSFPTPVVVACNGSAYPMGAFLMLASDVRIGADGPFKIGLNEVAIGLTVPYFAVELARQRLTPAYFHRTVIGEMLAPREAVLAGFLDRVVAPEDLQSAADTIAEGLTKLSFPAHAATKLRVRGPALKAIQEAIDTEITLENARKAVAHRAAAA